MDYPARAKSSIGPYTVVILSQDAAEVKSHETENKKGFWIAGGVVALIVIAGIVAALLFNINSYKSKIETAASGATGLDVRIDGKMGLSFFPLGVSARISMSPAREPNSSPSKASR